MGELRREQGGRDVRLQNGRGWLLSMQRQLLPPPAEHRPTAAGGKCSRCMLQARAHMSNPHVTRVRSRCCSCSTRAPGQRSMTM